MCTRCRQCVLRETPLTVLLVLRDEPGACEVFQRAVDAEVAWRLVGQGIDDPRDEHT